MCECRTAFHLCVASGGASLLQELLQHEPLRLESRDHRGRTALYYALFTDDASPTSSRHAGDATLGYFADVHSIPAMLKQHGADLDSVNLSAVKH